MNLFGFTLTPIDILLLSAAGTLVGLFIKCRIASNARHASACAAFRSSVLNTLEGLYPVSANWPKDPRAIDGVLRATFPKLQAAVAEFRHFVPWYLRKAFDRAWFVYRLGEDGREIDKQAYWQYIPSSGVSVADGKQHTHDNTLTYKDDFKRNVERLLKYAKQT